MKADYFVVYGNWESRGIPSGRNPDYRSWMDLGVTRGRVTMRTIIKSIFEHINIVQGGGLYNRVRDIAIRNRNILEYGSEHRKACVQEGKHRNAMLEHGQEQEQRIRTGTGTGTKLETVILRSVWWYQVWVWELNPGILGVSVKLW